MRMSGCCEVVAHVDTGARKVYTIGGNANQAVTARKLNLEIQPKEQRTPEYFAKFLKEDVERWGKVIKAANISMD